MGKGLLTWDGVDLRFIVTSAHYNPQVIHKECLSNFDFHVSMSVVRLVPNDTSVPMANV